MDNVKNAAAEISALQAKYAVLSQWSNKEEAENLNKICEELNKLTTKIQNAIEMEMELEL